jgi:hypothetical protein
MTTHGLCGTVAGLMAIGWLVQDVHAIPTFGPGMQRSGQDQPLVVELRKIKQLLEKADHDYKGHRLKAVEDISAAIHLLEHKRGTHPTMASGGKGKSQGGKEPQAESDKQLREALRALEDVHKQLSAEHHKQAAQLVLKAMGQLKEALKVA